MLPNLSKLIAKGESATLELKRSSGELREAMQTLCAFANGKGGRVVIGVKPNGELIGQQVSDQTLHEIAAARERFEPPLDLEMETVKVAQERSALVLSVSGIKDSVPFTFDGRAFERVGNTTRKMSQERYEALLLERAHSRRRWENQEADEITLKDIDRDEVFRIVRIIQSIGRLSGPIGKSLPDVLDRLGLRKDGKLLRAALVLFGKTFLPDYPQCELRMARFRDLDKAEFLDQRQLRGPAFKLLEEAEIFCQRHFPLPAKIVPGQMRRVETPLIPPDAMREILVNAFIHRDYTIAGGAVSLAIFDNRVEVWSAGKYPNGITAKMLTGDHPSVQRNPIIADTFHRTGLIEKWGRGTNRVAEMCKAAAIAPPEFSEIGGAAVVTFMVPVAVAGVREPPRQESRQESQQESQQESRQESAGGSKGGTLADRIIEVLAAGQLSRSEISRAVGQQKVSGQLNVVLKDLLHRGVVTYTIPEKPQSRLQKYRLTERGRAH